MGTPQPSISAYVPCFNNADALGRTIESLRRQTFPIAELFVIDDGSKDESCAVARSLGVRVLEHSQNLGRGAARQRAMREASHDLVLCCDAAKTLASDFLQTAVRWFQDQKVAAVVGQISGEATGTVAGRWRNRHLFKSREAIQENTQGSFSTYGALLRKTYSEAVGGYDSKLRQSEDGDLGRRLIAAGYQIIFDPRSKITCNSRNTAAQVLERYWRWNANTDSPADARSYLRQIFYSIKVMSAQDLEDRDPLSVLVSLWSPHYQLWRSLRSGRRHPKCGIEERKYLNEMAPL